MKKEKVEYICLSCKYKFKVEYTGWKATMDCIKCGKTAQYASIVEQGGIVGFQKYKEVTALVTDKRTGEPLWVDKKGNHLKYGDSQVRYDLRKDPHGWRATGKKVRSTDRYGREM